MASLDGEDPLGGTEASFGSSSIAPDQETEFLDFPHISNYDIERRLGTGGMGAVWLAYDTRLGRKVALKLPRTEFAMDERRLHLFVREARAASALNHPNIITIYEAGESNGFHFVAMEFIEGVTVRRLMRDRSMPPKEAIRITRQIAAALEAAHRAGIIHRDMKPDNVMVRPDGLVKVLDFGAAYVETAPGGVGSKKNETILIGTPRYMSPEQARGKVVDSRSDIFSVGIMLYEMLAGQSPFPGNTQAEVFAALLEREPARLADEALDFVVRRALAKEPGDRYQSMDEFAAALDAVQGSVPITGVASAGTTPPAKTPPPDRSWRRRWRILTAAGVAAVAGLCLAGFYVAGLGGNWFHDSVPPETLPFTTFPGTKAFSSFSPDGNQIAFSWDGADSKAGGNRSIYVKLVGVGEPVRLTNDPAHDDSNPAWSPDGTHIAFQRGRIVMTIPVLPGGSERKIAESGPAFRGRPSPDGKRIAFVSSRTGPEEIWVANVDGGGMVQLTHLHGPTTGSANWSPDGRWIAFDSRAAGSPDVFVIIATTRRKIAKDRSLRSRLRICSKWNRPVAEPRPKEAFDVWQFCARSSYANNVLDHIIW